MVPNKITSAESNETLSAIRKWAADVDFQNMPQSCSSLWLKPVPSPHPGLLTHLHLKLHAHMPLLDRGPLLGLIQVAVVSDVVPLAMEPNEHSHGL